MDHKDRLIGVDELAKYLEVPKATIYGWRNRGVGPPGFQVGKHVRFRWTDIERWIDDRLRKEAV